MKPGCHRQLCQVSSLLGHVTLGGLVQRINPGLDATAPGMGLIFAPYSVSSSPHPPFG